MNFVKNKQNQRNTKNELESIFSQMKAHRNKSCCRNCVFRKNKVDDYSLFYMGFSSTFLVSRKKVFILSL